MSLIDAIHNFTSTLAQAIPIALGLTLAIVIGWIYVSHYLRARAREQSRIWRNF